MSRTTKKHPRGRRVEKISVLRRRYRKSLAFADITLKSESGLSIFSPKERLSSKNIRNYFAPLGRVALVRQITDELGLRYISHDRVTISVGASLEEFERIFGGRLSIKRYFPYSVPRKQRRPGSQGCGVEMFYKGGKDLPAPPSLAPFVERIRLPTRMLYCESPTPPDPSYFHLAIPDDVARQVNAVACHDRGYDGSRIRMAMPDQGTFSHAYYTAQGYAMTFDDSAFDETAGEKGHGTAIACNALAAAPAVDFVGVRTGTSVAAAVAYFNAAVLHSPHVISVSWGLEDWGTFEERDWFEYIVQLESAICQAIDRGITVCVASGNGGPINFPTSMPEVISVGGTYADQTDALERSTYASSGMSLTYPGRQVPDLVGLVGHHPRGVYITLPIEPGWKEDVAYADLPFPDGDATPNDDGWLVASGTSSAAPQVAGVAALLMQLYPTLRSNPELTKNRLMATATEVPTGRPTGPGVDAAPGVGLVDAYVALNETDLWIRCNDAERGIIPKLSPICVSPDIKVLDTPLARPSSDFDAAAHISAPVYGETYYVYIRVRNRGVADANLVTVGFYYSDPRTLITYPDDWNNGQSGDPALGSITVEGTAGNYFALLNVPARSSRVAGPYEWTPPDPTTATSAGTLPDGRMTGHFCLLARADCLDDPIHWTGGDWRALARDNNLGVRNVWVATPDVDFPLGFAPAHGARECFATIDTRALDESLELWFMIPEELRKRITLASGEAKKSLRVRRLAHQLGFVALGIPSGAQVMLDLVDAKPMTLRFRFKGPAGDASGGQDGNRGYALIREYADGTEVGGAAFEIP